MKQLYLFVIFYLLIHNIQAQELKATILSENEVELVILNNYYSSFLIQSTLIIHYQIQITE